MDYQFLFNIVLSAFGALAMFLIVNVNKKIDRIAEENRELLLKLNSLQILVAGQYVTRNEFDAKMETLFKTFSAKLDSIDDKLERRART